MPQPSSQGRLPNNRLAVFEDKRYDYDAHGRMVRKRSGNGGHHRTELHWDAEHQLQRSLTHKAGRVTELHYAYDPFGRRIAKYQADSQGRPQAQGSHWYVWDGNRLLQELSPQPQGRLRTDTYVYEPESFVPLAQLQSWERLTPKIKPVDPADLGHAVAAQLPHPTEALIVGDTDLPPLLPYQPTSGLANRMQNTYEATFFDKEFCLAKSSDASSGVFLTSAHDAKPKESHLLLIGKAPIEAF